MTPMDSLPTPVVDALELAWGIIANAGNGDWTKETTEWQAAAVRWRDHHWAVLNADLK